MDFGLEVRPGHVGVISVKQNSDKVVCVIQKGVSVDTKGGAR